MGFSLSKQFQENTQKFREFQMESQQMQIERQSIMHTLIQERDAAMDIAKARDLVFYHGAFMVVMAAMCIPLSIRKNQILYLTPLLPSAWLTDYFYDIAFKDRTIKRRDFGEKLLMDKDQLFVSPNGPITVETIDARIKR